MIKVKVKLKGRIIIVIFFNFFNFFIFYFSLANEPESSRGLFADDNKSRSGSDNSEDKVIK